MLYYKVVLDDLALHEILVDRVRSQLWLISKLLHLNQGQTFRSLAN